MALLKPIRIDILKRLAEPRTCAEIAAELGETPQKIYYHVKALEKVDLVAKVEEQRVRALVESYYQARARSYWLAAQLVSDLGGAPIVEDQISLRVLLELAEEMHHDIGQLANRSATGEHIPSLSLSGQIYLPDASRRAEFLDDVQRVFQELAHKYSLPVDEPTTDNTLGNTTFRLILVSYPKETTDGDT